MGAGLSNRAVHEDGWSLWLIDNNWINWLTTVPLDELRKQSTASRVQLHSTTWAAGRTSSWKLSSHPRMGSRRLALGIPRTALIIRGRRVRWIRSGSRHCRTKLSLSCLGSGRLFSGNGEWDLIWWIKCCCLSANMNSVESPSFDICFVLFAELLLAFLRLI